MSDPLIFTAELFIKPDRVDEFVPLLEQAVIDNGNHPACEFVAVHRNPTDPTHFHLYEQWTSADGFAEMMTTPHYVAYQTACEPMFSAKRIVRLWTTVEPTT